MKLESKDVDAALIWFKHFSNQYCKKQLSCISDLLPHFEHQLIYPQTAFHPWRSFKALVAAVMLDTSINQLSYPPATKVFFWPVQLHHPRFQSLLFERLQELGIGCYTLYFREDMKPVLEQYGMAGELAKPYRNLVAVNKIANHLYELIFFFINFMANPAPIKYKRALIKSWVHLSTVKIAEATARMVMKSKKGEYHLVGYDLSIVGRAIIRIAREYSQMTGRIQNGAVNYRLSGYSEVNDLFMWDEESAGTYRRGEFKGNIFVTGNILLQEKYPAEQAFPLMNPVMLPGYKKRALVAFSGPGHNTSEQGHIESLKVLHQLIKRQKDVLFVIKLHPKDKPHYYQALVQEKNVLMATSLFPYEMPDAINFIHATDFVITGASSVALDALFLRKIIISIDPLDELTHFEFLNEHSIINTNRFSDEKAMLESIQNSIAQSVCKSHIFNTDGVSKILEVIKMRLTEIKNQ